MTRYGYFMDKQTMKEIGLSLWQMRQDKHLYLHQVARLTNLPIRTIDGLEVDKFFKYQAVRTLLEFYGKKFRIVFE